MDFLITPQSPFERSWKGQERPQKVFPDLFIQLFGVDEEHTQGTLIVGSLTIVGPSGWTGNRASQPYWGLSSSFQSAL